MEYQILLIRHGMTKGNEEGRYIGRTDESLSPKGRDVLLKNKVQIYDSYVNGKDYLLFSSPMKRCLESCEILFEGQNIEVIDDFKEIDFGLFENKNYEELNGRDDYQEFIDSNGESDFPNGEKQSDFKNRVLKGFSEVLKNMSSKNSGFAVIVCHGGTIMTILESLTGENYFSFQIKNGFGYKLGFKIEGDVISEVSYCCV